MSPLTSHDVTLGSLAYLGWKRSGSPSSDWSSGVETREEWMGVRSLPQSVSLFVARTLLEAVTPTIPTKRIPSYYTSEIDTFFFDWNLPPSSAPCLRTIMDFLILPPSIPPVGREFPKNLPP